MLKPICVTPFTPANCGRDSASLKRILAQELKVSRGPVREALLRLERDGLVVTTLARGTFIRDISLAEIDVIFRMRAKA